MTIDIDAVREAGDPHVGGLGRPAVGAALGEPGGERAVAGAGLNNHQPLQPSAARITIAKSLRMLLPPRVSG